MVEFEPDKVLSKAKRLPPEAMVGFALACAERLQPYAEFASDPAAVRLVRAVLDAAFSHISGSPEAGEEIDSLSQALEASEFLDDDAAASAAYVARLIMSGDPQNAVWAAQRAYDARDLEAQGALGSDFTGRYEEALLAYPSVQLELKSQLQDLEELEQSASPASVVLRARRVQPGAGS